MEAKSHIRTTESEDPWENRWGRGNISAHSPRTYQDTAGLLLQLSATLVNHFFVRLFVLRQGLALNPPASASCVLGAHQSLFLFLLFLFFFFLTVLGFELKAYAC
jgi:hypothetical protein